MRRRGVLLLVAVVGLLAGLVAGWAGAPAGAQSPPEPPAATVRMPDGAAEGLVVQGNDDAVVGQVLLAEDHNGAPVFGVNEDGCAMCAYGDWARVFDGGNVYDARVGLAPWMPPPSGPCPLLFAVVIGAADGGYHRCQDTDDGPAVSLNWVKVI